MIHIKENLLDDDTIAIKVDGVLDQGAVPVLEDVCERYLSSDKVVHLNLKEMVHVTREGRAFLRELAKKVQIANLPEFIKLTESEKGRQ